MAREMFSQEIEDRLSKLPQALALRVEYLLLQEKWKEMREVREWVESNTEQYLLAWRGKKTRVPERKLNAAREAYTLLSGREFLPETFDHPSIPAVTAAALAILYESREGLAFTVRKGGSVHPDYAHAAWVLGLISDTVLWSYPVRISKKAWNAKRRRIRG